VLEGLRFPYTAARTRHGEALLRPQVPMRLSYGGKSLDTVGLLDSGADVNVLPYRVGTELGADWSDGSPLVHLSGNLARVEARGVILDAAIGHLPPVRLAFAWTRAADVPLLLGQVNFFAEFDVCFFRSRGFLEPRPRALAEQPGHG
jgi:hypothetical protein